ncbi:FAD-dependent oxidoreductase [Aestuariivirga sp.]|uniref:FAD-dependent oxidoreductase n=1 Tax=Aestuariivirga sp. TaxID=2650926 RepID=UPI003BAD8A70
MVADTLVIGAGVVGTATAYYLAREGLATTVLDAASEAAVETSFANGGLVTPSTAFPWSSPGALRLLLKYMGREDAPMLLRPGDILKLGGWGLRFALNCRPAKYRQSARLLSNFAHHSLEELTGLLAQQSVSYELYRGGLLQIYRDDAGAQNGSLYAAFLRSMGIACDELDRSAVLALEPLLGPIAGSIRKGLLLPGDAWGDARLFTHAVEKAARQLSVAFDYGVKVTGLHVENGRVAGVKTERSLIPAERVVLCAGAATPRLLAQHGITAPICPVKGYSITLRREDIGLLPARPIVDDHAHLGVTPLGDRLRVAGTVEFSGHDTSVRDIRIGNLTRALANLFPNMNIPADISPWAGLRPMTPDGLPIIDRTPIEGLFVNSGHGALGWTLSCGSADLISRIIMGREANGGSPFALNRSYW